METVTLLLILTWIRQGRVDEIFFSKETLVFFFLHSMHFGAWMGKGKWNEWSIELLLFLTLNFSCLLVRFFLFFSFHFRGGEKGGEKNRDRIY